MSHQQLRSVNFLQYFHQYLPPNKGGNVHVRTHRPLLQEVKPASRRFHLRALHCTDAKSHLRPFDDGGRQRQIDIGNVRFNPPLHPSQRVWVGASRRSVSQGSWGSQGKKEEKKMSRAHPETSESVWLTVGSLSPTPSDHNQISLS